MNGKKSTAPFLLCAMLLLFIFTSCGTDAGENEKAKENEKTNGEDAREKITDAQDDLPESDFGGYDFRIYMRDYAVANADFYAENEVGEPLNDAVYNRNKKIGERFNINIEPVFYPNGEYDAASAQKSISAGDDVFDIAGVHGAGAFIMAGKNLALDWLENMPYVNFDKPWWIDDIRKNFSAFGKLYCMAGDISHTGLASTGCMLFNKNLFADLGIEYPYADVTEGKWTLDKFMSLVRSYYADLNGDGVMSVEDDRYGAEIRHEWDYPISVLYCGGDRVIAIGGDGTPELAVYNERTVDIFNKFFDMMNGEGAYLHIYSASGEDYPTNTAFRAGRSLFYTTYLRDIVFHRDLEYEIGILPLPKYDVSTPKYYTNVDAGQNVFAVPVTSADTVRTSIIVEALCAEGHYAIMPAFYEVSLKTKHARDNESSDMIDYIKDGRVYDYGYFNSSVAGNLAYTGRNLVMDKNPNFTSFYERESGKVQANIDALNK